LLRVMKCFEAMLCVSVVLTLSRKPTLHSRTARIAWRACSPAEARGPSSPQCEVLRIYSGHPCSTPSQDVAGSTSASGVSTNICLRADLPSSPRHALLCIWRERLALAMLRDHDLAGLSSSPPGPSSGLSGIRDGTHRPMLFTGAKFGKSHNRMQTAPPLGIAPCAARASSPRWRREPQW
jgi:hypothetical protein